MSAIPAWARVGAKVVCVDDVIHPEWHMPGHRYSLDLHGLRSGQVYTIRRIGSDRLHDGVGVWLVEITRGINTAGIESSYAIERFRPLITKSQEQDVAIFRHHLDTTRADA